VNTAPHLLRILAGTLLLTIIKVLVDSVLGSPTDWSSSGWLLLSNFTVVLALSYPVLHSSSKGIRLALAVFLLYFGVSYFNTFIEGVFFQLDIRPDEVVRLVVSGLLVALLFSPLFVMLLGRMSVPGSGHRTAYVERSRTGWIWRIAAADCTYFVLYIIAGMIVFPYVKQFYATKALPGMTQIFLMQVFRGLVFLGVSLPLMRAMTTPTLHKALSIGLAFSVLGGISLLILPNPYMPENIRMAHLVEVGISNFIFGVLAVFLLDQKTRPASAEGNAV
jgi:hypothetical protein